VLHRDPRTFLRIIKLLVARQSRFLINNTSFDLFYPAYLQHIRRGGDGSEVAAAIRAQRRRNSE
jgi:hypothetical protein